MNQNWHYLKKQAKISNHFSQYQLKEFVSFSQKKPPKNFHFPFKSTIQPVFNWGIKKISDWINSVEQKLYPSYLLSIVANRKRHSIDFGGGEASAILAVFVEFLHQRGIIGLWKVGFFVQ